MIAQTRPSCIHLLKSDSTRSLKRLFMRAYKDFGYYRSIFERIGLTPDDDPVQLLTEFPVLGGDDFRKLQAEIFNKLNRCKFHTDSTSGTYGKAKMRFSTKQEELAEKTLSVRFFQQCRLVPSDRVLAIDIDSPDIYLFYGQALKTLGVREFMYQSAPADSSRISEYVMRYQPTVILTVPSLLMRMYPQLRQALVRICEHRLAKIIYIGENMPTSFRQTLMNDLGVEVFSFFGSTEIGSVGGECHRHDGVHLYTDCAIPTIINPQVTADVIRGEVVWTTLHFTARPLIKYATHDVMSISTERCQCGNVFPVARSITRIEEGFALYGCKFDYADFYKAIASTLRPPAFMQIRLESDADKEVVTFVLPTDFLRHEEQTLRTILKADEFEYLIEMGFIDVRLAFQPAPDGPSRKHVKVIDRRATRVSDRPHDATFREG